MNKQHFRQKCNTTTSRSKISVSKKKQQNQNRIGPFINYIYWLGGQCIQKHKSMVWSHHFFVKNVKGEARFKDLASQNVLIHTLIPINTEIKKNFK